MRLETMRENWWCHCVTVSPPRGVLLILEVIIKFMETHTSYLTWEEADQNDEQLQSEPGMEEKLESYLSGADNDLILPETVEMECKT